MRMGLREANQSFAKAIKAVKAGKEVILTERESPSRLSNRLNRKRNLTRRFGVWRRREYYDRL